MDRYGKDWLRGEIKVSPAHKDLRALARGEEQISYDARATARAEEIV